MELKEKLLSLPTTSGCYIMKDLSGNVIYVGKAKNLKRRVNSYFIRTQKNIKTENLVKNIADFDYIVTATEYDCLMLENNLIKKYKPHYNILLKDDKNFPYIKINLHQDYPRLEVTRKIKKDGAKYFGPYFAGVSVYQIVDMVSNAFGLRTCNAHFTAQKGLKRACLNYDMGLCSAPCINKISQQEYMQNVQKALDFLNGNTKQIEQILSQKMNHASENLNFETAIKFREQLNSLARLKEKYLTQFTNSDNFDVIGGYFDGKNACVSVVLIRNGKMLGCENFNLLESDQIDDVLPQFIMQYYSMSRIAPSKIYVPTNLDDVALLEQWLNQKFDKQIKILVPQKGDKKQLISLAESNAKEYLQKSLSKEQNRLSRTIFACERLQQLLKLKRVPKRMECYDISHISGTNKVASMVVFTMGEADKSMYRKFIIKTVEGNNDFASLHETLTRRLKELDGSDISFSQKPDLIIIDGGKGQLSSTAPLLKQFGVDIDIVSLAKQDEEIYTPFSSEPVRLKRSDLALQLVQRIRDEAHRFAITFHRQKRSKTMIQSQLDGIKGVGQQRKRYLFKKYGSVNNLKTLTFEQMITDSNIPKSVWENIYKKLND